MAPAAVARMRILVFGRDGKVGTAVSSGSGARGPRRHAMEAHGLDGIDVAVDFTRPDAVETNVRGASQPVCPS